MPESPNCVMRTSHKLRLLFGLCMLDILLVRIVHIDPLALHNVIGH